MIWKDGIVCRSRWGRHSVTLRLPLVEFQRWTHCAEGFSAFVERVGHDIASNRDSLRIAYRMGKCHHYHRIAAG